MKKNIILCFFAFMLSANEYSIEDFEIDLHSKTSKNLQKIVMDLEIKTTNKTDLVLLKDSLNIITSSFYVQDLLSSKGKEAFKEALKQYTFSKYKVQIQEIYILSLKLVDNVDIQSLIELIEEHYKNSKISNKSNTIKDKLLNNQKNNTNIMLDNLENFGDVDFYKE